MKTSRIYPWLNDEFLIIGAEGEGSEQGSSDNTSGGDDAGDGGENQEENSSSSQEHDDADDPKVKGLKSALAAERARADAAEKDLKKRQKAEEAAELAKKDELEREKIRADAATEKATKLAEGLLKRDINAAIRAEAEKAGFIDVDDALAGVDRTSIIAEQHEDDPTQISIDLKTITTQVKALAAKKPHFIKQGTDDGEATGSQFGGSKQKKKGTDEDTLKELYPSLRSGPR